MKIRFIVNLRSGRAARVLPQIRRHAAAHGAEIVFTERAGHARDLAAKALRDECELIVAVGGDGTMNETATALQGMPATLGLIPCGSGDGLGRHLGLHGSVDRALDILRHGQVRTIDSGTADGHAFFNVAGIGFEAEIACRFNRLQHRGFARYFTTTVQSLRTWQPLECEIRRDGRVDHVRAFTIAVANCGQWGNGAQIAPAACVDDGLLDLCALPPVTWRNVLPLARRLFNGTLDRSPGILRGRAARFTLQREQPGWLHTDGEVHEAGARIEFEVRPASLRIMCPS